MIKIIYLTIYLLVLFSVEVFSQNYLLRDEAYKVLKKNSLIDTLTDEVWVSTQIISSKTILKFMDDKIQSPEWESWFFLIDKHPLADWTHPCKYVFVNEIDKSFIIIDGQKGASFPTIRLLAHKNPVEINQIEPVFKENKVLKSAAISDENNYAIIISGGMDQYNNALRYWNNCSLVYKTLITKNYKPENIYVLSADGTDNGNDSYYTVNDVLNGEKKFINQKLDLDNNGTDDIAYAATKTDISTVFNLVQDKVSNDVDNGIKTNVFIYVTDHGGLELNGDAYLFLWGEKMTTEEFFNETKKLEFVGNGTTPCPPVGILMDQCSSGGFADKFSQIGASITTSCKFNEYARGNSENTYGLFIYAWLKAINDPTISSQVDTNGDNNISFNEAGEYAKTQVKGYSMTPQHFSVPPTLEQHLTLDNIDPKVYCYNGKQDNGESGVDIGGICLGGGPIVVDPPDHCVNPPTCGNGTCDPGEENACMNCRYGDCGSQFVDEGFRINGSFCNIVYIAPNDHIAITPRRGSFYFGQETERRWIIYEDHYVNNHTKIIECNDDLTETSTVFHEYHRFQSDATYFKIWGVDRSNLSEGKYYKIVISTYFDDNVSYCHPEGWVSSYKYVYILPSNTYNSSSSNITYIQSDVLIQDKTISGNVIVKAKSSIKIKPNTYISANFNARINPNLFVSCFPSGNPIIIGPIILKTAKSTEIDSSYIPNYSDKTNNIILDLMTLGTTEESNVSIYPNPNNGSFTVLLKNDAIIEISVINMYGQEVCYNINKTTDSSLSVSLYDCVNGTYIVKLKGKQKTYMRKIIVKAKI